jgi:hypothetical protein
VRIILLDFDGVLNTVRTWGTPGPAFAGRENSLYRTGFLDPDLVRNLDAIVRRTGAKVFLSTAWREMYPMPVLRAYLKFLGLSCPIEGKTPDGDECGSREVRELVRRLRSGGTKIESMVLLDDRDDMEEFLPFLVLCDPTEGLTTERSLAAIRMLERPPCEVPDQRVLGA